MPLGIAVVSGKPCWRRAAPRLCAALIVAFFLASNGIGALLVGGSATIGLGNSGEDFDKFYTHEREVAAARWLAAHRNPSLPVHADAVASLRLISFGGGITDSQTDMLPSAITKEGYVYLRVANLDPGITEAVYRGRQISYEFPLRFVDTHKDLIYDNGGSRIYR